LDTQPFSDAIELKGALFCDRSVLACQRFSEGDFRGDECRRLRSQKSAPVSSMASLKGKGGLTLSLLEDRYVFHCRNNQRK